MRNEDASTARPWVKQWNCVTHGKTVRVWVLKIIDIAKAFKRDSF